MQDCPYGRNTDINGQSRRISPTREHNPISGEHIGSPQHHVIQWFKKTTINYCIFGVKHNNWQPFNGKLWQRNYWEHIIRSENDYHRIAQYIINNRKNWNNDKLR